MTKASKMLVDGSKFALLWGIACVLLHVKSRFVLNPAVLPDEYAYFSYIGAFARSGQLNTSQYGPLYILLASAFYDLQDVVRAYSNVRVMNLVCFASAVIPLRLLAGHFISGGFVNMIFAFAMLLLPWSSFITPIWAEPLFYMLYCWGWYLCFLAFRTGGVGHHLLAGTSIGLMFLAKQAGGMVLFIAFLGAVSFDLVQRAKRKETLIRLLAASAPMVLLVLAYLVVTRFIGVGGVGYSNVGSAIARRFFQVIANTDFYRSFFVQLSYLVLASFFFLPMAALVAATRWRTLESSDRKFLLLVGAVVVGLAVLIAFFNNTVDVGQGDPREPGLTYGRYLTPLVPPLMLLGIRYHGLLWEKEGRRTTWIVGLGLVLLLAVCSPLYSAFVAGIIGSPDIMYLPRLFGFEFPPWDRVEIETIADSFRWHIAIAVAVGGGAISWIYSRSTILGQAILVIIAVAVGQANMLNVRKLALVLKRESDTYRYLAQARVKPDELLRFGSYEPHLYMAEFWIGELSKEWLSGPRVGLKEIESYARTGSLGRFRYVLADQILPSGYERVRLPEYDSEMPIFRLVPDQ